MKWAPLVPVMLLVLSSATSDPAAPDAVIFRQLT